MGQNVTRHPVRIYYNEKRIVQSAYVKCRAIGQQKWQVMLLADCLRKCNICFTLESFLILWSLKSFLLLIFSTFTNTVPCHSGSRLHSFVCWIFHYTAVSPFIKPNAKLNADVGRQWHNGVVCWIGTFLAAFSGFVRFGPHKFYAARRNKEDNVPLSEKR